MDKHITWLDSPTDIMVSKYTSASELKPYIGSFFKIRSAVFSLCMEGTIECSLNSSECIIKQHNVITLVPNSFVEVHTISPDIELYLVAFSSDFMGCVNYIRSTMNCITYIYRKPIMPVPASTACLFKDFYGVLSGYNTRLHTVVNKEMTKAIFMICSQGIVGLYKKNERLDEHELDRYTEIFQNFLDLALKFYTTQHNVSFYAEKLGLTLPYFCTSVKKAVGRTPLEIIVQIIITDAKAELKGTHLEIKKIAIGLGFSNLSFFNKFFRQHVGMTPQEYRGKSYTF